MSVFVHYAQETLWEFFSQTCDHQCGTFGFGSVFFPKLVWCVAWSDIFFTCCLVVLKLISAMNIKKKVIIKSKTKQNTYYDKESSSFRHQRQHWKQTPWLSCIQKFKEKISLALRVIVGVSVHLKKVIVVWKWKEFTETNRNSFRGKLNPLVMNAKEKNKFYTASLWLSFNNCN